MSELRSVIESLRGEVLADQPDAYLEEDFCELHRAIEQLEVERLRRLAEIDRRGLFARDGHLSAATGSWRSCGSPGERRAVRSRWPARSEQMPATRSAMEAGEVFAGGGPGARRCPSPRPRRLRPSEPQLVEAAGCHSVGDLHRIIARWRERVLREAGDPEAGRRAARRLHASRTFLGMVRVDADLDPETGASLLTALGAVFDAEARTSDPGDRRTPAQRRADALGEICRGWLHLGDRPTVAGERPHLQVLVDAAALGGGATGGEHLRAGATAELDHAGPIALGTVRRLACGRDHPRGDGRALRAARRGTAHPRGAPGDAPCGGDPRSWLPVPRL